MSQGSRFITPTLQSNFNYTINEILQRMNQGLIYETWIAIESLYLILPPEIHDNEDIEKHFKEIQSNLHNGQATSFQDQREEAQRTLIYLANHNKPMFREMYKALYDGNYLERKSSRIGKDSFNDLEKENESPLGSGQS